MKYRAWEREAEINNLAKQQVFLQAKVDTIFAVGDQRRWGYVRKLKLASGAVGLAGFADILQSLSTKLSVLDLDYTGHHSAEPGNGAESVFCLHLIDHGVRFPALTHLCLGMHALRFMEHLPIIFNSSPHILHFELTQHQGEWKEASEKPDIRFGTKYINPTKIRTMLLYVYFSSPNRHISTHPPGLFALLGNCPEVRDISIGYNEAHATSPDAHDRIVELLESCTKLRNLDWEGSARALLSRKHASARPPSFPGVRH